jgi:hypothetical protein
MARYWVRAADHEDWAQGNVPAVKRESVARGARAPNCHGEVTALSLLSDDHMRFVNFIA